VPQLIHRQLYLRVVIYMVPDEQVDRGTDGGQTGAARYRRYLQQAKRVGMPFDVHEHAERLAREDPTADSSTDR